MYTLDDMICSALSLNPGHKKDIAEYARKAEEQAKKLRMNDEETLRYIEDYIRDCLN